MSTITIELPPIEADRTVEVEVGSMEKGDNTGIAWKCFDGVTGVQRGRNELSV
jgi:hypothetical protein